MAYSYSFFFRTSDDYKDTKLCLRVIVNRRKREISTGQACLERDWDPKLFRLKKTAPNHELGNIELGRLMSKIHRVLHELVAIPDYTLDHFNLLWDGDPALKEDFYAWAESEVEKMRPVHKADYLKHYGVVLGKMKTLRPTLTFAQFTPDLVIEFRNYMANAGNHVNTIDSNFKRLKRLVALALQQGKMRENPFRFYRSKRIPTQRVYLTPDEVKLLESMFYAGEFPRAIENVTRNFLFCCFTGIRYGDLADLTWSDVWMDHIALRMNKTSDVVYIPLVERARKLFPPRERQFVFRVPANQVTNRFLGEMAKQAGIGKQVSSHSARHTFATLGITLGIPIEVISKILGHHDLKTTQIYAKIVDEVKFREMKKFDDF